MSGKRFQDLQVYQLAEKLSDEIWEIVNSWEYLAKDTVDKQTSPQIKRLYKIHRQHIK